MKKIKGFLVRVLLLAVGAVVVAFLRPAQYRVERSVLIQAKPPASRGTTPATWATTPCTGYCGLFMNRLMGPDFEQGLGHLRRIVEAR